MDDAGLICMGCHAERFPGSKIEVQLDGKGVENVVAACKGDYGFVLRYVTKDERPIAEVNRVDLRNALLHPDSMEGRAALSSLSLQVNDARTLFDEKGPVYEVLRGQVTFVCVSSGVDGRSGMEQIGSSSGS